MIIRYSTMSVEQSYAVTLKVAVDDDGSFTSARILKARSSLPEDIMKQINKALSLSLVPQCNEPVKTSVAIGICGEQMILNHLRSISKVNMDFEVIDTSSETGHGDIAVMYKAKRICIEVKNYSHPVPMHEIEKYHRSMALPEYDAGIIIQMNECGFAREAKLHSPIDIRINNNRISVYLSSTDVTLLYPVINMIISQNANVNQSFDHTELERARMALSAIHEKVSDLRSCIESQKKTLLKMQKAVEEVARLSTL